MFTPGFTGPTLLKGCAATPCYRIVTFFDHSFQSVRTVHSYPLSLAATHGVAVAFLSSGY